MKKFLFFALILCMTSCIVNNEDPCTCTPGNTSKTITVIVKANDWQYSDQGNNNYFYVGADVPEITEHVFDKGEVKAYLVKDRNNSYYARKHVLPYVMHKEDYINGNWVFYTETVDFTYGIGWAEFNFRASDFAYEESLDINPEEMEFDIVITKP
jgi:hypothetical protein